MFLALTEAEIGTLSEARHRPVLVTELEEDSSPRSASAFLFGDMQSYGDPRDHPARTTIILLGADAAADEAQPVVIGIEEGTLPENRPLLSPHAAVIGLAHLLHPLARFRPALAAATVFQPVSVLGRSARGAFRAGPPDAQLRAADLEAAARQMAFNVLDAGDPGAQLEAQLKQVLQAPQLDLSVQVLRAGIFHGFGIALPHLRRPKIPASKRCAPRSPPHPVIEFAEAGGSAGAHRRGSQRKRAGRPGGTLRPRRATASRR